MSARLDGAQAGLPPVQISRAAICTMRCTRPSRRAGSQAAFLPGAPACVRGRSYGMRTNCRSPCFRGGDIHCRTGKRESLTDQSTPEIPRNRPYASNTAPWVQRHEPCCEGNRCSVIGPWVQTALHAVLRVTMGHRARARGGDGMKSASVDIRHNHRVVRAPADISPAGLFQTRANVNQSRPVESDCGGEGRRGHLLAVLGEVPRTTLVVPEDQPLGCLLIPVGYDLRRPVQASPKQEKTEAGEQARDARSAAAMTEQARMSCPACAKKLCRGECFSRHAACGYKHAMGPHIGSAEHSV